MSFNYNPVQQFTIESYNLSSSISQQMIVELMKSGNVRSKTVSEIMVPMYKNLDKVYDICSKYDLQYIEFSGSDKTIVYSDHIMIELSLSKTDINIEEDEDDSSGNILNILDSISGGNKSSSKNTRNNITKILAYFHDSKQKVVDGFISEITGLSEYSPKISITWVVDNNGTEFNLTNTYTQKISDCLYPYLKNGVENYVDKFLASPEPILILIGEPGQGKTSLIRYILSRMNKKAYVTFDETVMSSDYVFGNFVRSGSAGAFVIEDADTLLKSRQDNNKLMAKFLNIGDGLISLGNKKLIFTTNLPSTKDIDPALMRRGRCFDVLNFRRLTLDEANAVTNEFNLQELSENKTYTLAEIFNQDEIEKEQTRTTGFGFLGK